MTNKQSDFVGDATNDLLQLPDIDGVMNSTPKPSQQPTQPSSGSGISWQLFERFAEKYEYRVKNHDRKNYEIDNEIVDCLKLCNINNMSVTNIINAALRSFITINRQRLRGYYRSSEFMMSGGEGNV